MSDIREVLRIVTVGHVDHGKSTVIGRLLYDTKSIPEGTINRVKDVCKEKGKPFEYAYLLDAFEEEQKQGITIDTTQLQFHTDKRDYVIIDAPGHKEFLKNMISGAASAEAALLIIDGNEGVQEQSKRHGYILSLLGIEQVYVIVNKMDLIDYSQKKFNEIKDTMIDFLGNLNVKPLKFIPISAFYGENLSRKSDKMAWYKGETVLESLDLFSKTKDLEEKALRFPIQDVYKFDHRRIIVGRIETGRLNVGDEILICPSKKTTKVKTIEYFVDKDKVNAVTAGMSVGITVEDEFFNKRGEVITTKENQPLVSDTINANIFWMGKNPLVKNKKYKLKLVTQEIECEIKSINKVIDATTLEEVRDAEEVNTNDVAEIIIKTKERVVFDKFSLNQNTGRFVLVDGFDVSGGGIVSGTSNERTLETTTLIDEHREFAVEIFDEYNIIVPEGIVKQIKTKPVEYFAGQNIPTKGRTYNYGDFFDIISVKNGLVARIRDAQLVNIVDIESYKYEGYLIIDSKGFTINIKSRTELSNFINDYNTVTTLNHKLIGFSNKWLDFSRTRTIVYDENKG